MHPTGMHSCPLYFHHITAIQCVSLSISLPLILHTLSYPVIVHFCPKQVWLRPTIDTSCLDSVHRGGLWQGEPPSRENPLAGRTPRQGEPPAGRTPWQGEPLARCPPPNWQGDPPVKETPQQGEPPGRETPALTSRPPGKETPLARRLPQQGEPTHPPLQGQPLWQGEPPLARMPP